MNGLNVFLTKAQIEEIAPEVFGESEAEMEMAILPEDWEVNFLRNVPESIVLGED